MKPQLLHVTQRPHLTDFKIHTQRIRHRNVIFDGQNQNSSQETAVSTKNSFSESVRRFFK